MAKLSFRMLPGVTIPSKEAIKDSLGERLLRRTEEPLDNPGGSNADLSEWDDPDYLEADHSNATLVTSRLPNGNHMPAIDIDLECMLLPSTKPGHYHLYINKEMTSEQYFRMLNAMVQAGVVEPGFYAHAVRRHASHLRYPGVTKHNEQARIDGDI